MVNEQIKKALEELVDAGAEAWGANRPCVRLGREALALMMQPTESAQPDSPKDAEPVAESNNPAHPMQPIILDKHERLRFKENAIVRFLSEGKLNDLACMDFRTEDREQFAQLIGYRLSGYGELSYVTNESYERAAIAAEQPPTDLRAAAPKESIVMIARGEYEDYYADPYRVLKPFTFRQLEADFRAQCDEESSLILDDFIDWIVGSGYVAACNYPTVDIGDNTRLLIDEKSLDIPFTP